MSESHKGKTLTDETKAKLSDSRKGKPRLKADMAKLSEPKRRKPCSEATKAKLSAIFGNQVFIYDANTFELLSIQPSFKAAGRYLNIHDMTVAKYARNGQPFKGYLFRASPID